MIEPTIESVEIGDLSLDGLKDSEEYRDGMNNLGTSARNNAQRMAPVRTGKLRDSIDYEVSPDGTLYLYAAVDYAAYVELGTVHMAPQPFMRPAIESAINEVAS